MAEEAGDRGDPRKRYEAVLGELVTAAFKANGFDALCSLLRVGGMADANWDPFEESRAAFEDYDWLLERAGADRGQNAARRVALLMYCQAVEMSAPQEMLANLLRCAVKKKYTTMPFMDLGRRKKSDPFAFTPPSAPAKFRRINALANDANLPEVSKAIGTIFDDRVRNAFSHSDYILTNGTFRFSDGLLAQEITVSSLDRTINECFAFYTAFLGLHHQWLMVAARGKRFHRWPRYEVLELLRSEDEGVYGFRVHFSNGSAAWYTRRKTGIEAVNVCFDEEGGLGFHVGNLDALKSEWMIEGRPIESWDALP